MIHIRLLHVESHTCTLESEAVRLHAGLSGWSARASAAPPGGKSSLCDDNKHHQGAV